MATYSLFGDCVTQAVVEDKQHIRAIGLQSIVSLMAKPLPGANDISEAVLDKFGFSNYRKRCILGDLQKKSLNYLFSSKADFLIIDCCDCRMSLIGENLDLERNVENVECSTGPTLLGAAYNEIIDVLSVNHDIKEWFPYQLNEELYVSAVRKFCSIVKRYYKASQIIINKHFFANDYVEDNVLYRYNTNHISRKNELWENTGLLRRLFGEMENELLGCHTIDFPVNVIGVSPHRFGVMPLHYHSICIDYAKECISVIENTSQNKSLNCSSLQTGGVEEQMLLYLKKTQYEIYLNGLRNKIEVMMNITRADSLSRIRAKFLLQQTIEVRQKDNTFSTITDIYTYLEYLYLSKSRFVILLGIKDTPGNNMPKIISDRIRQLGFFDFSSEYGMMYAGLLWKGKTLKNFVGTTKMESVEISEIQGDRLIKVESHAYLPHRNYCSISIDGTEKALNRRGVNIVVYDPDLDEVIDSIAWDSHEKVAYFYRGTMKYKNY